MAKAYAVVWLVVFVLAGAHSAFAAGELGSASGSSSSVNITSTSETTPDAALMTVTATTPATPILVTASAYMVVINGHSLCNLWVDGSNAGRMLWLEGHDTSTGDTATLSYSRRLTLTAASHTFSLRCWKVGSTGNQVGATGLAPLLEVEDLAASSTGATTLHDLTDVNDAGKGDGDVLKYDGTLSKWVAGTDEEGSGGLSADDSTRLDLTWWGVWALVGLGLVALVVPFWRSAFNFEQKLGRG